MADQTEIIKIEFDSSEALAAAKDIEVLRAKTKALKEDADKYKGTQEENTAAHIRAQAEMKASAAELKIQEGLLVKMSGALNENAGTLDKVNARNAILRDERRKLKDTDADYQIKLKAINDELDRNTQFIKDSSDAQKKQTMNVGNYEGAISSLKNNLNAVTEQMQNMTSAGKKDSIEFDVLSQKADELKKAIADTNDQMKIFSGEAASKMEESLLPVKSQLKAIIVEMQNMAAAGKDDGEEFQELARKAGKLKDAMNATNDQIKVFATGDKLEATLKMAKGSFDALSGATQVYEGTMQSLGIENESAEKGIQKLVAIQSIQNGVTQVYEALQKESAFMLTVNTIKTNVMSASQAFYTAAIGSSTGALKAFKLALLATGIGAVIVAIGLLIANWDKLSNAINSSAKAQADYAKESEKIKLTGDVINKQIDDKIKKLKEKGATESEVSKTELARQQALISNAEKQKQLDIAQLERLKEKDKNGQTSWNKELASEIYLQKVKVENAEKNINSLKQTYNTSIALLSENMIKEKEKRDKNNEEKAKTARTAQEKRNKEYLDAENKKFDDAVAIEIEKNREEIDLKKQAAEESVRVMTVEYEFWKLKNKEKISGAKELTTQLIIEEEARLLDSEKREKELLKERLRGGQIFYDEYLLLVGQSEETTNNRRQELQDLFQQQESDKRKKALATDYENDLALAQDNMFALLDLQKVSNDQKRAEEIKAAEKIGADTGKIKAKYDKADLELEKAKTKAKLALAAGFAGNIATIFGESTKLGKAAAVAQTMISTYASATGAFASFTAPPVAGVLSVPLGIAAAGAAVASGLSNVKKILSVKADGTGSVDTSTPSSVTPSTPTPTVNSVIPEVGQGIVSRQSLSSSQQLSVNTQPTLVVDAVTAKQTAQAQKNETASL